ncbi:hypothetical protein NQ318_011713 [Aromia moschata]|uniref:Gustatory receptor n=1 Tax=Aromia moschata TaxID=1265417 RepID=A0AAV8XPT6_9CUCU|nr:hypothetical protein NQ318_011713 [Aromia moschata]
MINIIADDAVLSRLVSTLFFLSVFTTTAIFTQIAKNWTPFIQELYDIEKEFSKKYEGPVNLKIRINIATILIFSAALCEHIFSTVYYVYSFTCKNNVHGWEKYFKNEFNFIFSIFPYRFVYGVIILTFNWICWAVWNLGDTFIILLSLIMSTRFRQISSTLKIYMKEIDVTYLQQFDTKSKFKGICYPTLEKTFFRQIREDYNKMANICKVWDDLFSNLVIMSYAYNLSFILIQLFNSLRQMDTSIESIYFFYSFGFVIARTVAVSICAASVNQESQYFLPILNSVPSELYSTEVFKVKFVYVYTSINNTNTCRFISLDRTQFFPSNKRIGIKREYLHFY